MVLYLVRVKVLKEPKMPFSHRKVSAIPTLGICWEIFPLLRNDWDKIFHYWEGNGKSLGYFFPLLGSVWEIMQ